MGTEPKQNVSWLKTAEPIVKVSLPVVEFIDGVRSLSPLPSPRPRAYYKLLTRRGEFSSLLITGFFPIHFGRFYSSKTFSCYSFLGCAKNTVAELASAKHVCINWFGSVQTYIVVILLIWTKMGEWYCRHVLLLTHQNSTK